MIAFGVRRFITKGGATVRQLTLRARSTSWPISGGIEPKATFSRPAADLRLCWRLNKNRQALSRGGEMHE